MAIVVQAGLAPEQLTLREVTAPTITTNLPAELTLTVLRMSPESGVPYGSVVCAAGHQSIPQDPAAVFDRRFDWMAIEHDGLRVFMAQDVILTQAAPTLSFEEVGAGAIDDGGSGKQARIAGTVQIDNTAVQRDVLVISDDPTGRRVVGEITSQTDGTFDITYPGWTGPVIALALDRYGQAFAPETPLNQGDIVHPTTANGYVYEVTVSGTTGSQEPTWPTHGTAQSGSVTFQARPYYRPIASGPLQSEVISEGESPLTTITAIRLKDMQPNDPAQSYVTLSDLTFYDQNGDPIDLAGASASATSTHTNSSEASIIDGDPGTHWYNEAGVFPVTVEVAFAQPVHVTKFLYDFASGDPYGPRAPSSFDVEVILDGGDGTWQLTDRYSGNDWSGGDQEFAVSLP